MTPHTESQTAFARRIGCAKSWVTKLKADGRLVLGDDGKVDVEKSLAKIAESNGAPERASVITPAYSDNRDRRERIEADLKQIDLDERRGKLMESDRVVAAIADAITTLRSRFEAFPDMLAAPLAAIGDEQEIRALLADHIEGVLGELSARFSEIAKAPE